MRRLGGSIVGLCCLVACSGTVTQLSGGSTTSATGSTGSSSSSSAGGGSGSSGAGGSPTIPACVVPKLAPSQGSCVAFTSDAGPGSPEADAGFDDAGNASVTNCNPITNAGCTQEDVCLPNGQLFACQRQGFQGNVPVCGDCASGRTCTPTKACIRGWTPGAAVCVQMCCTDADCGDAGACVTTGVLDEDLPSGVGLCISGP